MRRASWTAVAAGLVAATFTRADITGNASDAPSAGAGTLVTPHRLTHASLARGAGCRRVSPGQPRPLVARGSRLGRAGRADAELGHAGLTLDGRRHRSAARPRGPRARGRPGRDRPARGRAGAAGRHADLHRLRRADA